MLNVIYPCCLLEGTMLVFVSCLKIICHDHHLLVLTSLDTPNMYRCQK